MPKAVSTQAERQFETFLAKYSPEIVELARVCLAKMRALIPGAVELVYDNYNALVVGFGPSERASEAPLSIAMYPRWINLYFLRGAELPDPKKILKGGGNIVRNLTLTDARELDRPEVRRLIALALKGAKAIDGTQQRRMVIRAVSPKQRPRRAAAGRGETRRGRASSR